MTFKGLQSTRIIDIIRDTIVERKTTTTLKVTLLTTTTTVFETHHMLVKEGNGIHVDMYCMHTPTIEDKRPYLKQKKQPSS